MATLQHLMSLRTEYRAATSFYPVAEHLSSDVEDQSTVLQAYDLSLDPVTDPQDSCKTYVRTHHFQGTSKYRSLQHILRTERTSVVRTDELSARQTTFSQTLAKD